MNLEPVLRAVVAFRTPHLKALITPDVIRAYQTPRTTHPAFRTLNVFPGWVHPPSMPPCQEGRLTILPDRSAPVLALVRNHGWTTLESQIDDDGPIPIPRWEHSVDQTWFPGEGDVHLWLPLPDLYNTEVWDKNIPAPVPAGTTK